jgi:hypothetical protein
MFKKQKKQLGTLILLENREIIDNSFNITQQNVCF